MNSISLPRRSFRGASIAWLIALPLAGCMSLADYGEAPGYETGFPGTPQEASGWYGRDVASVEYFYSSLGRYGRWDSYPGYGRVFIPLGVRPGWQPYRDGYWAVDPRYGRRWISSEPFGWATYHYGRWARDPRLGWFWVPDTRFGPGWVNWREGGGYSGWAPLPPIGWERYGVGYNPWGYDSWLFAPSPYLYRPGLNSHIVRGKPHYDRTRPVRPPQWTGTRPPGGQMGRPVQWTGRARPPGWTGSEERQPDQRDDVQADGGTPSMDWRGRRPDPGREVVAPPPQQFRRDGAERQAARLAAGGGTLPRQIAATQPAPPPAIRPATAPPSPPPPAREARAEPRETRAEPRQSLRSERNMKQPD